MQLKKKKKVKTYSLTYIPHGLSHKHFHSELYLVVYMDYLIHQAYFVSKGKQD